MTLNLDIFNPKQKNLQNTLNEMDCMEMSVGVNLLFLTTKIPSLDIDFFLKKGEAKAAMKIHPAIAAQGPAIFIYSLDGAVHPTTNSI